MSASFLDGASYKQERASCIKYLVAIYFIQSVFLIYNFLVENFKYLDSRLEVLEEECITALRKQGFSSRNIVCEAYLNLRYQGTDCALMCSAIKHVNPQKSKACSYGDFEQAFIERLVQLINYA